jgi:predicted MPP superfamily phosphohydrolase
VKFTAESAELEERDGEIYRRPDEQIESPDRRVAMSRLFAGGIALTGTTLGTVAVGKAIAGFSITEVEIELSKLPRAFDGFKIVQLSDVHVGPTIGRAFVEQMVQAANSLDADVVAITGDLVDGSVENLREHTEPLRNLRSRSGTFFVTGNHEYYSGADDWIREMQRLGIVTLRNSAQHIERGTDALLLAGVTDHRAGEFGDPPDLKRALRYRQPGQEVVLLAHQPREVSEAKKHDVGLQLSGHTHGGQFWPWNWAVHLLQPVVAGLARFGRTQIYVNTGTGYWGPPMRLGTEAEITLVTLRCPV